MSILYPDLNLTDFPKSIDTFTQWLDITASDGPLIKQYTEAMQDGDIVTANEVLSHIPSGTQKIIKAVDLNKLTQAILAVERFYKSDIQSYISNKQLEWETIINQFNYLGKWSIGKSYTQNNMVSYSSFGEEYIYIAIKNVPTGIPTSNKEYWRQVTVKGEQGVSGTGLSYRDEWKVSTSYSINDAVTYSGALWVAVTSSKGEEPTEDSNSWKNLITLSTTTYPIQSNQPLNQITGDLWFNTQGNPTKFYYLETLQAPATSQDILAGKEAYDQEGKRIVGTSLGGSIKWNSETSVLKWE